jgi:TPR repeat protein
VRASVRLAAATACALLWATAASAADFETGRRAYRAGDYAIALQEWTPLAEAGNPEAAFGLGLIFDRGHGVARDAATAALWYRRAAEAGHAGAAFNLGNLYRLGEGVAADPALSAAWWERAAKAGLPQAQVNLGVAYQKGEGVPQDDREAFGWYRKAAEAGEPLGQFYLGVAYEAGIGVAPDVQMALAWYRRAAANGEPRAQARLAELAGEAPPPAPGPPPPEPEPEPRPEPEPQPTVAEAGPGYFVQVIAMGSQAGAEAALATIGARVAPLLDGVPHRIQEARSGGATVFRVQFGPFAALDEARDLCRSLRDRGQECLVVAP